MHGGVYYAQTDTSSIAEFSISWVAAGVRYYEHKYSSDAAFRQNFRFKPFFKVSLPYLIIILALIAGLRIKSNAAENLEIGHHCAEEVSFVDGDEIMALEHNATISV